MDELLLIETIEKYEAGELSLEEMAMFDALRQSNQEVDQFVVEYHFFNEQTNNYGQRKAIQHSLQEVESDLLLNGTIKTDLKGKAKIIQLFNKYKRVSVIAACIAGVVSIFGTGMNALFNNNNPDLIQLGQKIEQVQSEQKRTQSALNEFKSKIDPKATPKSGGTGFLVDGNGYIVTNAHVIKGSKTIAINSKGQQFVATVCVKDNTRDLAIIKIDDIDFKPFARLPYAFNKNVNLAASIFTLGFPKDEIVYTEGYLSSISGYKSDTLSYQISIAADNGNSGGPVLNKNGEVIGILTDKVNGGAVFALKTQYIFNTVNLLKNDSSHRNIKLPTASAIKNLNREDQVKKVNDCVFLIKSYE